jgi:hypothetical protein
LTAVQAASFAASLAGATIEWIRFLEKEDVEISLPHLLHLLHVDLPCDYCPDK